MLVRVMVAAVALSAATVVPAYAKDVPPKGNNDSTGCCFSFRDSPVILCMTKDACTFTQPPTGGK